MAENLGSASIEVSADFSEMLRKIADFERSAVTSFKRINDAAGNVKLPALDGGSSGGSRATDELTAKIRALSNEVGGLRNQFVAVGGSQSEFAEKNNKIKAAALEAAAGLDVQSDAYRKLTLVAAQAERAIVASEGGVARLGLASQVAAGLTSPLLGILNQLGGLGNNIGVLQDILLLTNPVSGGEGGAVPFAPIALGATAAVAAIGGLTFALSASVNAYKEFEFAIDGASATLEASAEQTTQLEQIAQSVGSEFGVLSTQVAQAFEELGSAGLTAKDVLEGAGKAATVLARATGADIREVAEIYGQARSAFSLTGAEFEQAADVIANAANSTILKVGDFQEAIGQGGAAARIAGVNFTEFAGIIALLRPNFSSASDAGTSFKTFITSLTGSSDKAKAQIKELGLEFFDLNGNIKAFPDIIDELGTAFNGLNQKTKLENLKDIFGADAFRAAEILASSSGKQLRELTAKLSEVGTAAATAEKRLDNLKGSFDRAGASVNSLLQKMGEAPSGVLKKFVDGFTGAINQIGGDDKLARLNALRTEIEILQGSIQAEQNREATIFGIFSEFFEGLKQRNIDGFTAQIRTLRGEIELLNSVQPVTNPAGASSPAVLPQAPRPSTLGFGRAEFNYVDPFIAEQQRLEQIKANNAEFEKLVREAIKLQQQLEAAQKTLEANPAAYKAASDAIEAFTKDNEAAADALQAANEILRQRADVVTENERKQKELTDATNRANKSLNELNDSFRVSLKDGKATRQELETFRERYADIAQAAQEAGVKLETSATRTSAALLKQAEALIRATEQANTAKKAAEELARANQIEQQTLDPARREAYTKAVQNATQAQLENARAVAQANQKQAEAELRTATTAQAATNAAAKYNDARSRIAVIEKELEERYTATAKAANALVTAEQRRQALLYGGERANQFTIAAIEAQTEKFTSLADAINKVLASGATLTGGLLAELERRFPRITDAVTDFGQAQQEAFEEQTLEEIRQLNAVIEAGGVNAQDAARLVEQFEEVLNRPENTEGFKQQLIALIAKLIELKTTTQEVGEEISKELLKVELINAIEQIETRVTDASATAEDLEAAISDADELLSRSDLDNGMRARLLDAKEIAAELLATLQGINNEIGGTAPKAARPNIALDSAEPDESGVAAFLGVRNAIDGYLGGGASASEFLDIIGENVAKLEEFRAKLAELGEDTSIVDAELTRAYEAIAKAQAEFTSGIDAANAELEKQGQNAAAIAEAIAEDNARVAAALAASQAAANAALAAARAAQGAGRSNVDQGEDGLEVSPDAIDAINTLTALNDLVEQYLSGQLTSGDFLDQLGERLIALGERRDDLIAAGLEASVIDSSLATALDVQTVASRLFTAQLDDQADAANRAAAAQEQLTIATTRRPIAEDVDDTGAPLADFELRAVEIQNRLRELAEDNAILTNPDQLEANRQELSDLSAELERLIGENPELAEVFEDTALRISDAIEAVVTRINRFSQTQQQLIATVARPIPEESDDVGAVLGEAELRAAEIQAQLRELAEDNAILNNPEQLEQNRQKLETLGIELAQLIEDNPELAEVFEDTARRISDALNAVLLRIAELTQSTLTPAFEIIPLEDAAGTISAVESILGDASASAEELGAALAEVNKQLEANGNLTPDARAELERLLEELRIARGELEGTFSEVSVDRETDANADRTAEIREALTLTRDLRAEVNAGLTTQEQANALIEQQRSLLESIRDDRTLSVTVRLDAIDALRELERFSNELQTTFSEISIDLDVDLNADRTTEIREAVAFAQDLRAEIEAGLISQEQANAQLEQQRALLESIRDDGALSRKVRLDATQALLDLNELEAEINKQPIALPIELNVLPSSTKQGIKAFTDQLASEAQQKLENAIRLAQEGFNFLKATGTGNAGSILQSATGLGSSIASLIPGGAAITPLINLFGGIASSIADLFTEAGRSADKARARISELDDELGFVSASIAAQTRLVSRGWFADLFGGQATEVEIDEFVLDIARRVSSGFESGLRSELQNFLLTGEDIDLGDGLRQSIASAVAEGAIEGLKQSAVIKPFLDKIVQGIASGADISEPIANLTAQLPALTAQLENQLRPVFESLAQIPTDAVGEFAASLRQDANLNLAPEVQIAVAAPLLESANIIGVAARVQQSAAELFAQGVEILTTRGINVNSNVSVSGNGNVTIGFRRGA